MRGFSVATRPASRGRSRGEKKGNTGFLSCGIQCREAQAVPNRPTMGQSATNSPSSSRATGTPMQRSDGPAAAAGTRGTSSVRLAAHVVKAARASRRVGSKAAVVRPGWRESTFADRTDDAHGVKF